MRRFALSIAAFGAKILPLAVKRRIYRIRPLASLIRGGLNRAAPQGMTWVEVAAGELAGAHLQLDLQTEKDYWLGTYEPELQASLADLVQPGMVIYDVGANIGYISLLFSRRAGPSGRVFAFEALPENVERLEANVERNANAQRARIQVVDAAVVDTSRRVSFLVAPSGGMGKAEGSAGRQGISYMGQVEVQGISLDEFAYTEKHPLPDLVKMDIEGGEVMALPGMQRLLAEARPIMMLEMHGPESLQAAWKALTSASYRVSRMAPGYPVVRMPDELDWKSYLVAFPFGK